MHHHPSPAAMPTIQELGADLATPNLKGIAMLYLRPVLTMASYVLLIANDWYWLLAPWAGFHFVYLLGLCHEAVHGAAGIGPKATNYLLLFGGLGLMESGHGFRLTHIRHHSDMCEADDIEGEGARTTWWGSLLMGPIFLPRVLAWAIRHSKKMPIQHQWIMLEVALVAMLWVLMWPLLIYVPEVGIYMCLMWLVSWIKPFSLSYLLHLDYDHNKADQIGVSVRGWLLKQSLFGLTWHMEHHLYPQVPTHRLPELATRLQPWMSDEALIYHWV